MGSEFLTTSPDKEISYSDIFEEHCPYYMALGLKYEDYWEGDCALPRFYRKAEKIRVEKRNQEAWLHGMYFLSALNASVGNLFRKKSTSPIKYMEAPLPLFAKEAKPESEQERAERFERIKRKMLERTRRGKQEDG